MYKNGGFVYEWNSQNDLKKKQGMHGYGWALCVIVCHVDEVLKGEGKRMCISN